MKNQYFGDINDYRKYGLLRCLLAATPLSIAVCWMLTTDDGGGDGRRVRYLQQPDAWRSFDPELFDLLHDSVIRRGVRHVRCIEESPLLPRTSFCADMTPARREQRHLFLTRAIAAAAGSDLVFFDPDNGMEVASVPCGRRGAEKYLYWQEAAATYQQGHTILVYQHFPRRQRGQFVAELARRFNQLLGVKRVFSLQTASVVFMLVPQRRHFRPVNTALRHLAGSWSGQIVDARHDFD